MAIFGLETKEEKAAKFFMMTFAYLFHLLLFCSLSPIGTERLGGIKKTKGTHYSRFFLKMLIYTLSIGTESCTSLLRHARLARFEKTEVRVATRLPILCKKFVKYKKLSLLLNINYGRVLRKCKRRLSVDREQFMPIIF